MSGMQRQDNINNNCSSLEMTANKHMKVEKLICNTYHSLRNGKLYDTSKSSHGNEMAIKPTAVKSNSLLQNRETGLSYSETMMVINIYCMDFFIQHHMRICCFCAKRDW
jgi:hypothetical protein